MKKLLPFLMILFAICMPVGSDSEVNFDLSKYTDSEIIELSGRIQEEMVLRRIEKTAILPAGWFIGGKDIPTGTYVYTSLATGEQRGSVKIYSELGNGDTKFFEIVTADEQKSFYISVEKEDQLQSDVSFSLQIFGGPMFK